MELSVLHDILDEQGPNRVLVEDIRDIVEGIADTLAKSNNAVMRKAKKKQLGKFVDRAKAAGNGNGMAASPRGGGGGFAPPPAGGGCAWIGHAAQHNVLRIVVSFFPRKKSISSDKRRCSRRT